MARFDRLSHVYDLFPLPNHPERVRAQLGPHLQGVPGPLLDLAGGTGKYTARMVPHGTPTVVLDVSRGMLARGLGAGRTHAALQGVAQRLPFADASFSAVTLTEAFHHLAPHQERVLGEIARVLREDGLLLIEEADPSKPLGRLLAWGEAVAGFGSRFRSPVELAGIASQHFGDVRTERTGSFTYLLIAREPR